MKFYHCHYYICEGSSTPSHIHNKTEFIYYLRGDVRVTIGDKQYSPGVGGMIVIPAGVVRSEYCEGGFENIALLCDLDKSCDELTAAVTVKFPEHIRPLFIMLAEEYKRNIAITTITESLFELIVAYAQSILRTDAVDPCVRRLTRLINENFSDPTLEINALCEGIPMSRDHLRVLFREYNGMTPHEYLQSLRLSRAKQLLCVTCEPISYVAELVGYNDAIYFSRKFKLQYGVSPSEFRNNYVRHDKETK